MTEAVFALAGVALTGLFAVLVDMHRRRHERAQRAEERNNSQEDHARDLTESRLAATRVRREAIYLQVVTRLLAADQAAERAEKVLYAEAHEQGYHPFSVKGTIDWAIDELEALRGLRPEVDLFASPAVADAIAAVFETATRLRFTLGMISDGQEQWSQSTEPFVVSQFREQASRARELMRSELAPD